LAKEQNNPNDENTQKKIGGSEPISFVSSDDDKISKFIKLGKNTSTSYTHSHSTKLNGSEEKNEKNRLKNIILKDLQLVH
jgi:hypothetical protein